VIRRSRTRKQGRQAVHNSHYFPITARASCLSFGGRQRQRQRRSESEGQDQGQGQGQQRSGEPKRNQGNKGQKGRREKGIGSGSRWLPVAVRRMHAHVMIAFKAVISTLLGVARRQRSGVNIENPSDYDLRKRESATLPGILASCHSCQILATDPAACLRLHGSCHANRLFLAPALSSILCANTRPTADQLSASSSPHLLTSSPLHLLTSPPAHPPTHLFLHTRPLPLCLPPPPPVARRCDV
jgi:hypothetical protein